MQRILITGPIDGTERYAEAARSAGWQALEQSLLAIRHLDPDPERLGAPPPSWVAVTSSNALPALAGLRVELAGASFACVGERTTQRVAQLGFRVAVGPARDAAALAEDLARAMVPGERARVLWLRGSLSSELAERARSLGVEVAEAVVYETVELAELPPLPAVDAVFFASPSAVRRYTELVRFVDGRAPRAVAIGATTLRALEERAGDHFAAIDGLAAPRPDSLQSLLERLFEGDPGHP